MCALSHVRVCVLCIKYRFGITLLTKLHKHQIPCTIQETRIIEELLAQREMSMTKAMLEQKNEEVRTRIHTCLYTLLVYKYIYIYVYAYINVLICIY